MIIDDETLKIIDKVYYSYLFSGNDIDFYTKRIHDSIEKFNQQHPIDTRIVLIRSMYNWGLAYKEKKTNDLEVMWNALSDKFKITFGLYFLKTLFIADLSDYEVDEVFHYIKFKDEGSYGEEPFYIQINFNEDDPTSVDWILIRKSGYFDTDIVILRSNEEDEEQGRDGKPVKVINRLPIDPSIHELESWSMEVIDNIQNDILSYEFPY